MFGFASRSSIDVEETKLQELAQDTHQRIAQGKSVTMRDIQAEGKKLGLWNLDSIAKTLAADVLVAPEKRNVFRRLDFSDRDFFWMAMAAEDAKKKFSPYGQLTQLIVEFLDRAAGQTGCALREDFAKIYQVEHATDLSGKKLEALKADARQAEQRIEAAAMLLGIKKEELLTTLEAQTLVPARVDGVLRQVYANALPMDTKFDKAQALLQIATTKEFMSAYARSVVPDGGFLTRALKRLAAKLDGVPYELPAVRGDNGRILVSADKVARGGALLAGVTAYAHPQVEKELGPLLSEALAEYIATYAYEPLDLDYIERDTEYQKHQEAQGVIHRRKVIPHADLFFSSTHRSALPFWWEVAKGIGHDALVRGFFVDPAGLKKSLEATFGEALLPVASAVLRAGLAARASHSTGAAEVLDAFEALPKNLQTVAARLGAPLPNILTSDGIKRLAELVHQPGRSSDDVELIKDVRAILPEALRAEFDAIFGRQRFSLPIASTPAWKKIQEETIPALAEAVLPLAPEGTAALDALSTAEIVGGIDVPMSRPYGVGPLVEGNFIEKDPDGRIHIRRGNYPETHSTGDFIRAFVRLAQGGDFQNKVPAPLAEGLVAQLIARLPSLCVQGSSNRAPLRSRAIVSDDSFDRRGLSLALTIVDAVDLKTMDDYVNATSADQDRHTTNVLADAVFRGNLDGLRDSVDRLLGRGAFDRLLWTVGTAQDPHALLDATAPLSRAVSQRLPTSILKKAS